MKKLKSKLRFNDTLRSELADSVTKKKFPLTDLDNEIELFIIDLVEKLWEKKGIDYNDARNLGAEGIVPVAENIKLCFNGSYYQSKEKHPLPYEYFFSQDPGFFDEELDLRGKDLDERRIAVIQERKEKRAKLLQFFRDFTSPAKLLEKAPQFLEFFPDSWLEDSDEEQIDLDELLEVA